MQVASQNGEEIWGLFQGIVILHRVTVWYTASEYGWIFLPDLLHDHVMGQNAAANNQILLAVSLQL